MHSMRLTRPRRFLSLGVFLITVLCACSEAPKRSALEQAQNRAPTGQQCRGTTPVGFPANPGLNPHSMGQLGACVRAAQCAPGNVTLRSRISSRYCQDANRTTCNNNDDCLNLDCKGRLSGSSQSVVLANCQNAGPGLCGAGEIYCLCDAEVAANSQVDCGCECTNTVLP